MYSNGAVTLALADFAASASRFTLLLETAATRVPDEFMRAALREISVADCDGREMACWDAARGAWAGRRGRREPELDLCAFYVSFRNGSGKIVTVAIEAAG